MAKAKNHPKPKKRPAKRGTAKVPKIESPTFRSDTADPIFKLIENWKAAEKGYEKVLEMRAAEKTIDKAAGVASDALRKVCDTPPQTLAGLTALVRAMRPDHEDESMGAGTDYGDRRTFNLFATLETALVGLSDSVSGMLGADQAGGVS